MKKLLCVLYSSIALFSFACDDDDHSSGNNNEKKVDKSITFECREGIQITHSPDTISVSMLCDAYGDCNAQTNRCNNPPTTTLDASSCSNNDHVCDSNIIFVCNDKTWFASQDCVFGCQDNHSCKTSADAD